MIVLLGGSGYVGQAIQQALQTAGHSFEVWSRKTVRYTDRDQLITALRHLKPDFLINAAGFTGRPNVDACEYQKTDCLAGNAVLPGIVRDACEAAQVPWGHVSSGCIFTGTRSDGSGFAETDPPNFSFRQNNCSFYSGCKALGEEVLHGASQCYIWRLRIPFNEVDSPRNYLSKMMRYDRLLDATNSLSQLDEFAAACVACWDQQVDFGTYNLTNPGHVTTRDVVRLITESGLISKEFRFFESEAEFMQKAAITPRSNCVLDSTKAIQAGLKLTPIEDAIRTALKQWKPAA